MKRLLLVDDDPDILASLAMVLEDRYDVVTAANGAEALAQLDGAVPFDLVILDLMMPGVSGGSVLKALAGRSERPPVLLISAHLQAADAARQLGANDFIPKPFRVATLEEKLQQLLARPGFANG